ncbi:uncharacterized protein LOC124107561 [Marmota monax]|uniref:uncharacterized protein LOC124107561 n=1 Tax=Marmota monax TaxID=9995 RepID=UPI0026F19190|nr:uncharacterized protein LOC124107561 [Marmota monax]
MGGRIQGLSQGQGYPRPGLCPPGGTLAQRWHPAISSLPEESGLSPEPADLCPLCPVLPVPPALGRAGVFWSRSLVTLRGWPGEALVLWRGHANCLPWAPPCAPASCPLLGVPVRWKPLLRAVGAAWPANPGALLGHLLAQLVTSILLTTGDQRDSPDVHHPDGHAACWPHPDRKDPVGDIPMVASRALPGQQRAEGRAARFWDSLAGPRKPGRGRSSSRGTQACPRVTQPSVPKHHPPPTGSPVTTPGVANISKIEERVCSQSQQEASSSAVTFPAPSCPGPRWQPLESYEARVQAADSTWQPPSLGDLLGVDATGTGPMRGPAALCRPRVTLGPGGLHVLLGWATGPWGAWGALLVPAGASVRAQVLGP